MSKYGYVYVLANSSMPDVVKVGKTTRSPIGRAAELSSATGVPTPFIVVYSQYFSDCGAAEGFVHEILSKKGYRVSKNREFFNAPAHVVVSAVAVAPGAIDENEAIDDEVDGDCLISDDDIFENEVAGGGLSGLLELAKSKQIKRIEAKRHLWEPILREAFVSYVGNNGVSPNLNLARRQFVNAIKYGSIEAHGVLGRMCRRGEGGRKSFDDAIAFFGSGSLEGSIYCHWALGCMFLSISDIESAERYFAIFLDRADLHGHDFADAQEELTKNEVSEFLSDAVGFIANMVSGIEEFPLSLTKIFVREFVEISNKINVMQERADRVGDASLSDILIKIRSKLSEMVAMDDH